MTKKFFPLHSTLPALTLLMAFSFSLLAPSSQAFAQKQSAEEQFLVVEDSTPVFHLPFTDSLEDLELTLSSPDSEQSFPLEQGDQGYIWHAKSPLEPGTHTFSWNGPHAGSLSVMIPQTEHQHIFQGIRIGPALYREGIPVDEPFYLGEMDPQSSLSISGLASSGENFFLEKRQISMVSREPIAATGLFSLATPPSPNSHHHFLLWANEANSPFVSESVEVLILPNTFQDPSSTEASISSQDALKASLTSAHPSPVQPGFLQPVMAVAILIFGFLVFSGLRRKGG